MNKFEEAILKNDAKELKKLLDSYKYINGINLNIGNSLHYACFNKNLTMVELLIQYGADVNATNKDGRTALSSAILADNANKKIIELLLKNNANPNVDDILLSACHYQKCTIVEVLIEYGADVNATNKDGRTALSSAINNSGASIEIVELLLKNHINPNVDDILHIACYEQNLAMVELLIQYGADVNATDKDGKTALFSAIFADNANKKTVELLLKNNANPNVDNILHHACYEQNFALVKLLVENGADVNATDKDNETALYNAIIADNANKKIIRYLIANGADIHKENNNGISPLSFAESNKISLVKVLTEHEKIKPSETPLSNITNNEQSVLDKMVLQKKVIDKLKDDVKSIKEKTNNNQILEEYKIQIGTFQNTILSQSNEIIELQNKLLKKEEDIKELINNFTSKINTLEEKIKKQKVVKTMTPLVIPVEKQTINKTDGELIKRDSFDDF